MKRMGGMLLVSVVGLVLATALPVSGAEPPPPDERPGTSRWVTPPEERFYPACDEVVTTECIASVQVRLPGDTVFETASDDLMVEVSIAEYDTGDVWAVRLYRTLEGGSFTTELAPTFPVETSFRIVVRSGDRRPPGHMWAAARHVRWSTVQDDAVGWVQTMGFESIEYTQGGSACGFCDTATTASTATLQMSGLDEVKAEPDLSAYRGAIIAGNFNLAPIILEPGSQTISWWGFGSPVTQDGSPNAGWVEAYLPPELVRLYFGVSAQALVEGNALTVRNVSLDAPPAARFTAEDGGLVVEADGFLVEDQDLSRASSALASIAARRMVREPADVRVRAGSGRAVVRSATLPRVRGYQAMCYQRGRQVYARNTEPRVVVRGLTEGRWRCQMQGLRKNGGYWSAPVRVRITVT